MAAETKSVQKPKPPSERSRSKEAAITPRRPKPQSREDPPSAAQARRRRRDDDDYEDDPPARRKNKPQNSKAGLLIGLGVGGVFLLAVVVAVVWSLGRTPTPVPVAANNVPPNPPNIQPELAKKDIAPEPAKLDEAIEQAPPPIKVAPPDPMPQEAPTKPVVVADQSGGRKVDLIPPSDIWKGPIHPTPASKLQPKTIPLPDPLEREFIKNLAFSAGSPRAAVGYHRSSFGVRRARVMLCDLEKGAIIGTLDTPRDAFVEAVSDSGTQVLLRLDNGPGKNQHLELWNMSDKEPIKELEFKPYEETKTSRPTGGISLATFLDDKRLMTIGANAKVVVWDLPTLTPLYHTFIQGGGSPALSADRKLLGFTTGKDLVLLDLDAGKVLAKQSAPAGGFPNLRFSPDGKWLSLSVFGHRIYAWDVASGELRREMHPKGVFGHAMWTSNNHLLIGGNTAFDFNMQIRFWGYTGQQLVTFHEGLTWFVYQGDARIKSPPALIAAHLPHPAALLALDKAAADPNFLVLTEGTTVKLDVTGLPDAAERENVAKALQAQLEKNGCKVGPAGSISLIARVEPGKAREITYYELPPPKSNFGGGDRFKKVDIPAGTELKVANCIEFHSRLEFSAQGDNIWESSANNIPMRIKLEPGETVQQFLDKRARPNYEFFRTVELPRRLIRTGTKLLGGSRITEKGIQ